MLEELQRHGYRLSPGTLYPLLARMARRGWLRATEPKKARDARVFHITREGAQVLRRLRISLTELKNEVTPSPASSRRRGTAALREATVVRTAPASDEAALSTERRRLGLRHTPL